MGLERLLYFKNQIVGMIIGVALPLTEPGVSTVFIGLLLIAASALFAHRKWQAMADEAANRAQRAREWEG